MDLRRLLTNECIPVSTLLWGFGGNIMVMKKHTIAVLVALVLVTMGFAGCVSEGDKDDWKTPTQVFFEGAGFYVNETGNMIEIDFSLGDKDDRYTKASGTLRVAIWDSDDFEMLNKTFEIKSKDFFSIVILGLKATNYELQIPFSDLAKSHDWGYNALGEFTENRMHCMIWFEYKDVVFTDEYNSAMLNPEIPEALLHPNDAPMADLTVNNPGFVGMNVECDGSGSTDPEGGSLDYEWDWGDGDTISSMFATAEESHAYSDPGTYTIKMTVTDPEGATAEKTMDVTIIWILTVTVNSWGVVTEGDYVNQTYVDVSLYNEDDEAYSLTGLSFWLIDAGDVKEEYDAVVPDVPATVAGESTLNLMVYFDPTEGFTAVSFETDGQVVALS